jgi:hypothetical protein
MLAPMAVIVRQIMRSHLNGARIDDPVTTYPAPPLRRVFSALRTNGVGARQRSARPSDSNDRHRGAPPRSGRRREVDRSARFPPRPH